MVSRTADNKRGSGDAPAFVMNYEVVRIVECAALAFQIVLSPYLLSALPLISATCCRSAGSAFFKFTPGQAVDA